MILQLNSINRWAGDGVTTSFPFTFSGGYINPSHVKCYIRAADGTRSFPSFSLPSPFVLALSQPVPVGSEFTIYRDTNKDLPLVEFADGTALTEPALNLMARQAVFIAAEFTDATTVVVDGNLLDSTDDIGTVLNTWANTTLEQRLTTVEGDIMTAVTALVNQRLDPDLSPFGFKDMVFLDYSGNSTVSVADRGRVHTKAAGNVTVPETLAVGFHCNIANLGTAPITVTFGVPAVMQGSGTSQSSWTLAPDSLLHVVRPSAAKFFVSGNAT